MQDLYFIRDNNIAYLTIKSEAFYEFGKVKWRGTDIMVHLLDRNKPNIIKTKRNTPKHLYPLLKSNLQKQVRRQDPNAVTSAEILLDLNDFELLRRLPVIAAEDSELNLQTSLIVWLMAATSKGYVLNDQDKQFILKYIYGLVKYPICRRLEIKHIPYDPNWLQYNENLSVMEILNSNHPDKNIIAGILLRVAFGGLKGDPKMISRLCDWYLKSNVLLPDVTVNNIPKTTLSFSEACVDHHIYPKLIDLINNDTNIDKTQIRTVIWECSSGLNSRKQRYSKEEWVDTWMVIKGSFRKHTQEYLTKVLKMYF